MQQRCCAALVSRSAQWASDRFVDVLVQALVSARHEPCHQQQPAPAARNSCPGSLSLRHTPCNMQQTARLRRVFDARRSIAQPPTSPRDSKLNVQMLLHEAQTRIVRLSSAPHEACLNLHRSQQPQQLVRRISQACQHHAKPTDSDALHLHGGVKRLQSAPEQWCSKAASTDHRLPTPLGLTNKPTSNGSKITPRVALRSRGTAFKCHEDATAEAEAVATGLASKLEAGEHAAELEALGSNIASLHDRMGTEDGKGVSFPATLKRALVLLERGQAALKQVRHRT